MSASTTADQSNLALFLLSSHYDITRIELLHVLRKCLDHTLYHLVFYLIYCINNLFHNDLLLR